MMISYDELHTYLIQQTLAGRVFDHGEYFTPWSCRCPLACFLREFGVLRDAQVGISAVYLNPYQAPVHWLEPWAQTFVLRVDDVPLDELQRHSITARDAMLILEQIA